jgi:hypothetical protein
MTPKPVLALQARPQLPTDCFLEGNEGSGGTQRFVGVVGVRVIRGVTRRLTVLTRLGVERKLFCSSGNDALTNAKTT